MPPLILISIFRINLLRGTASLISAFLHPNGVHGLIAGTDKELGYWDLTTGLELPNSILNSLKHLILLIILK